MRALYRALVCALPLSLVASSSLAQPLPPRLVTRFHATSQKHPFARDDGRIPFTVRHSPSLSPLSSGLVPIAPGLSAIRLRPEEVQSFAASHPGLSLGYFPPLRPQMDKVTARSNVPQFQQATGLRGKGVVVGIIDTGIDVMHPDLRDASGHTRVAWMLDISRKATGKHPELEASFGCTGENATGCAIYDATDIDEAINTAANLAPRDMVGHGTHVASIAAGNGLGSADQKLAGMAPEATLVAVRVTRAGDGVDDTDVLLATRFIFERAEQLGMPAVINISLGSSFGPHDGTTALEQGLASFIGPSHPGRAIVVAAGNSGDLSLFGDDAYGAHTQTRVLPGATVSVPSATPYTETGTVRGAVYMWATWGAQDSVAIGIQGPDGSTWIAPIGAGEEAGFERTVGGETLQAGIINQIADETSPVPLGSHSAALLFSGSWPAGFRSSVLLEGHGTVDLWVEGTGDAAPSATSTGQLFLRGIKTGTIDVPASHPNLIAVGATINRTQWNDSKGNLLRLSEYGPQKPPIEDSIGYFSGAGPNALGVSKPDISAPGAFVAAAMSRDADPSHSRSSMFAASGSMCPDKSGTCLVVDEHHAIASGTSMAAPVVTGAIALLFSLEPNLTQSEVLALLQAGARWPTGQVPYDYQLGPGEVDLEGARQVLEVQGRPISRLPDPARSWLVLSSPYVRPDPNWPVCGTLETRASDGTIADGFDSTQLALETTHAKVLQPLTRLAAGLWRFCLTAPSGSGGQAMTVRVTYAGQPIGQTRALPIGTDYFLANEGLQARGGCALATGSTQPRQALAGVALAGALFSWSLRRRRQHRRRA